jgi:hypothetical protein
MVGGQVKLLLVRPEIGLPARAEKLNGRTCHLTDQILFGYPNLTRREDHHSPFGLVTGLENPEGSQLLSGNLFRGNARGTPFHPEDEVLSTSHRPQEPVPQDQTTRARKKATRPDLALQERGTHGRQLVLALGISIQGRQLQFEEALSVARNVQGGESNLQPVPHLYGG